MVWKLWEWRNGRKYWAGGSRIYPGGLVTIRMFVYVLFFILLYLVFHLVFKVLYGDIMEGDHFHVFISWLIIALRVCTFVLPCLEVLFLGFKASHKSAFQFQNRYFLVCKIALCKI